MSHIELGRHGEDLAAQWYLKQGYTIIDRNWRVRSGEIDIIASRDSVVAFVEVKARTSRRYGRGFDAIDYRKQQKVRSLAVQWLKQVRERETPPISRSATLRFDAVEVDGSGSVEVLEGCF